MKILVFLLLFFVVLSVVLLCVVQRLNCRRSSNPPAPPLTPEQLKRLLGRTGRVIGLMIPTGKVDFDGIIADAILEGIAVKPGGLVRAVRVEGQRVVVVPANLKVIPAEQG